MWHKTDLPDRFSYEEGRYVINTTAATLIEIEVSYGRFYLWFDGVPVAELVEHNLRPLTPMLAGWLAAREEIPILKTWLAGHEDIRRAPA